METYLQAEVSEGMFPNEKAVRVIDDSGTRISVLVDESQVTQHAIRVDIVRAESGRVLVRLPGEVYGSGRIIAVANASLQRR